MAEKASGAARPAGWHFSKLAESVSEGSALRGYNDFWFVRAQRKRMPVFRRKEGIAER